MIHGCSEKTETECLKNSHCRVSDTVNKDYNKKRHQSPTRKSYKHIWTSKKADVSVLQKMRAANLSQSFKTLILSEHKQVPAEMNWSPCVTGDSTHGDGGGGLSDLIIKWRQEGILERMPVFGYYVKWTMPLAEAHPMCHLSGLVSTDHV